MVLHGKSSRECSANAGDLQGFILGPALFLMQFNNLSGHVICNIVIYADDATLNLSMISHMVCGNN